MIPDQIVKQGFWYYQREPNFPPKESQSIDDGIVDDRLCLTIIESNIATPYQKRKIKDSWANDIRGNEIIRTLWLPFKVNQEMFDAVCTLPNLEGLWIKWSDIKSIKEIRKLKKLKFLRIGSSTQLNDISVLSAMNQLLWLELENLKEISDFSVIDNLVNLRGLAIEGSMWTTQRIDSLRCLKNLGNLAYLSLGNTRSKRYLIKISTQS